MNSNSQDIEIIAHLPLNNNDIYENYDDIFIKNNNDIEIDKLKNQIKELNDELNTYKDDCENNAININSNKSSDCWWCKYSFKTSKVELPELYMNKTFYCIGQFCSFNCAKSYNNDLNDDNVEKRTSLLHFYYKLTYKKDIYIKSAPSWKTLKQFGGILTIKHFRKNFTNNDIEYFYLHPPIISRYSQIEINNKKYCIKKDFVLKRSKPIKSSKYSLESSIGLKIIHNNE
jgi:hypothetical protein